MELGKGVLRCWLNPGGEAGAVPGRDVIKANSLASLKVSGSYWTKNNICLHTSEVGNDKAHPSSCFGA
ncbi:hypothetical protein Y1Q_0011221 [Alligator mississippiensis]|uniref:Uncharacterized protein n=1 Tax=Alligator mississippiensis TaxID=8496 RepID=A0A151N104_ALLMI|nr:hypothetical protein Y1Q_0011221 [Alligator mississippiensis]